LQGDNTCKGGSNKRISKLKEIITDKIISKMQSINSSKDLKEDLKKRPLLTDIPEWFIIISIYNLRCILASGI
jgi:hypothetical protein